MPTLRIVTTSTIDADQVATLLDEASSTIARGLGKSEDYVQVIFQRAEAMTFGGTTEPTAWILLGSIGLTTEQIQAVTPGLTRLLAQGLDVPEDRFYLNFEALERTHCAWNGKTFA